jgi:murein DD-endopeptidase MepM/ murein hydrolase activator NlpD
VTDLAAGVAAGLAAAFFSALSYLVSRHHGVRQRALGRRRSALRLLVLAHQIMAVVCIPLALAAWPRGVPFTPPLAWALAGSVGFYLLGQAAIFAALARAEASRVPGRVPRRVGQQLRVQPPSTSVQGSAAAPSYSVDSPNPGVIVQPVTSTVIVPPPATALPSAASAPAAAPNPMAPRPSAVASPSATSPALEGSDELSFAWPAHGNVISYFDESKTLKGLDIGGKTGDAVLAAADGKVVYAGNGLRGYGNLVILKHNNTYLSAYAHNQTLLVKEDQSVKRGQKIAEMGSTDSEQVNLHFEIRKLGKPVDPLKFLPPH